MTFVCMIVLRNKMEPNFSSIVWLSKWPSLSRTIRLINFSNRTGTSVDDGSAHGKDWTRLPVPNLPLCHWSSQLFGLHMHSSTDVPVLLLNQPIVQVQWWYHHGNVMWQILLSLSPRGAREDGLVWLHLKNDIDLFTYTCNSNNDDIQEWNQGTYSGSLLSSAVTLPKILAL